MKKLKATNFIFVDTDSQDTLALNYQFKIYRKYNSSTPEATIDNTINYIKSITVKSYIPKFDFIQVKLSSVEPIPDLFNVDKLNLVGVGFKYVIMETTT